MRYLVLSRQPSSFPVRVMCRVLRVSAAGYYDWLHRQPSVTEKRRAELAEAIRAIHADVKGRYGSPRMHAELVARQFPCSVNTVARVMKSLGIQAISHRQFRVRTTDSRHQFPVAGNELGRGVTAAEPNDVWPSDIAVVPTRERWLDLAAVASPKKGLVHHEDGPTIEAANAGVLEDVDVFGNRIRRHSSPGYVAPAEFESADSP